MTNRLQRTKEDRRSWQDVAAKPDMTSGGEPGQTEEERRAWKRTRRNEAQQKGIRPPANNTRPSKRDRPS